MDAGSKERETLIPPGLLTDTQDTKNHHEYSGSDSSAFTGFGSWGSSNSSFLNTPLGSELDSAETDSVDYENDDFIAELTRQMADFMLPEEDDDDGDENPDPKNFDSEKFKEPNYNLDCNNQHQMQRQSYASLVKKSNIGFESSQSYVGDQIQPIQYYQMENQPRVRKSGSTSWGKRGKMVSESTQQRKQQEQRGRGNEFVGNGGKGYPSQVTSGMRAVFLGGSGSRNASCGTGVFLPRGTTTDAPDHGRKKPGCSTVLIPTRVLQALEQHFNHMESLSLSPSNTFHPSRNQPDQHGTTKNMQQKSQIAGAMDNQETELPQEWIY